MAANKVTFDPKASAMDKNSLAEFEKGTLSENLIEVPGIAAATAGVLANANADHGSVTNTYQLIGKFLTLRPDEEDPAEQCDRFYNWLKAKGVTANKNTIVFAIALKVNLAYPGVYDATAYN